MRMSRLILSCDVRNKVSDSLANSTNLDQVASGFGPHSLLAYSKKVGKTATSSFTAMCVS